METLRYEDACRSGLVEVLELDVGGAEAWDPRLVRRVNPFGSRPVDNLFAIVDVHRRDVHDGLGGPCVRQPPHVERLPRVLRLDAQRNPRGWIAADAIEVNGVSVVRAAVGQSCAAVVVAPATAGAVHRRVVRAGGVLPALATVGVLEAPGLPVAALPAARELTLVPLWHSAAAFSLKAAALLSARRTLSVLQRASKVGLVAVGVLVTAVS